MPLLGGFWGTFPQMMSLIDLTPTRTILGQNHVISVCALTSVVVKIVEDKWPHTPRSVGGVSISLLQASYPIGGYTAVCDVWLVKPQTYGYLPSCTSLPPAPWPELISCCTEGRRLSWPEWLVYIPRWHTREWSPTLVLTGRSI